MQCLSPINLKDKEKGRINVPCGICLVCKAKRRNDWSFRLWQEYLTTSSAYFVTMTYDQEALPEAVDTSTGELLPTLDKIHCQLYIKRLRKKQSSYCKKHKIKEPQIRYYLCGEYGEKTKRPHYHMILFNMLPELKEKIHTLWDLGHVHIGTCNAKTIAYTTKYVMKEQKSPAYWLQPTFSLMSKNPPLGAMYLEKNTTYHENSQSTLVRNSSGKNQRLPPFFKRKIFSEFDIEHLSGKQLDQATMSARKEETRIEKHGNNVGKYQLEQLQHKIRRNNKNNKNEKL